MRWGILAVGLAASALLTWGLWALTGSFLGVFLFLPFLLGRQPTRRCPACGRGYGQGINYCPDDGTPMAQ